MDYELARQLKDAGFPQSGKNVLYISAPSQSPLELREETTEYGEKILTAPNIEAAYIPTLEELISALGPELFTLQCFDGKWDAIYGENGNVKQIKSADTATTAVAQLWLALTTKEKKGEVKS